MNGIKTEAIEYQDNFKSWVKIRDCVEGSKAVKAKTTTYLPKPAPNDNNSFRYNNYLLRAVFFNTTARTLNGLAGAIFRKPPKLELPTELEYMEEDADGAGCSVYQCSKETTDDVIQIGRAGLLVDFPKIPIDRPMTLEEEQVLNLRASILQYKAEEIINWSEDKVGAETVISYIVLKEAIRVKDPSNRFTNESVDTYRLLALDENGFYYQELYSADDKGNSSLLEERSYPTYNDGSKITRIPFVFIGSKNLKPSVDKAPLLDLSEINLSHYRNSADFEEMVFMIGQPTLVVSGLNQNWVQEVFKGKPIKVGARSAIELPTGADAKFIQIEESQISNLAMERKEAQMVAIGARVITSNANGVEAAETIRLRMSGESSILANIANNVSEGYTIALKHAALFMGANPDDIVYELNSDFFAEKLTPEEAIVYMEAWQKGVFAKKDVRDAFRKGEILGKDRDDDDIDEDINSEDSDFPSIDGNE